ncbi:LysR family transcriptional regulator [Gloeobacter kilaueensis]|uniref:LysR family transcriptional regulator n=1 Tax=Gloeobacter kilaueensis (strain ATCC BAA-2537 / CCAP 1431/1 / ULC 316 / JS1) TaxID=1183438 RepID=U5QKH6_GLOK1|nr:LysR family transcriptional regulator [Gloeobacter kilaueensis]AGY59358.1 LysR family transcriptional regulator [Gloeobacter kilaueensis JS1]
MELRHLRYFLAVAEELHFGRAAARLHIAQPPLSQQIQALEQEIGVSLFERGRRPVQLTYAGQVFLESIRPVLAAVEQAVLTARQASRGEVGRLVVGFVSAAAYSLLPDTWRVFRERYAEVTLVLNELPQDTQLRALYEDRIDVGFVYLPLLDAEIAHLSILQQPLVAALPANHPLASYPIIALEQLRAEPFILFPRQFGPSYYDQLVGLCFEAGFSPKVVQEANNIQTTIHLVAGGIGVALVPASVRNFQRSGVVYRELADPKAQVEVAAIWRENNASPVLEAFLNVVREVAGLPHLERQNADGSSVDQPGDQVDAESENHRVEDKRQ